ncbi:MAG: prolyl oligopeptidase family serine peptidase [Methylacidiphilales bacterium]|nr:prolyl oligopeptidase family serine peptidase [Candidatus Methylacidiphilales bacterium]
MALLALAGPLRAGALSQPVAPVRPVTDTYFGQTVTDPYRWLEKLKSPEVQAWMKAQNDYTRDYLAHLPDRDALVKRIEDLDSASTRVGSVEHLGSRYFYLKLTPQDQTPKLYVRDGLDGAERLLADPQVVGGPQVIDGVKQRYTISDFYPSWDGSMVAVEIAAGGSEEGTLRLLDAATGKLLPDSIDRIWGASVSWDPSGKFFYYVRLKKLAPGETPNDKELDSTACLHRLGDGSEKDTVVLSRLTTPGLGLVPTDQPCVAIEPGSSYAIGIISHGVRNEATLALSPAGAVAQDAPQWKKFVDVDDDVTDLAVQGHEIWLLTHKDAPHFKVVHLDLDHPDIAQADLAVPASDLVLKGVTCARDALYVDAAQGGVSHILRLPYGQKTATPITLPFAGSAGGLSANIEQDGVLMRLSGWTHAPQWYAYDPATGNIADTNLEPLNPADFSGITSEEVTAPGADGTPIPLSIIYRKDLVLNGKNPCLLEGYGAYGISIEPGFDATRLALLEKGIVVAFAHVRGGGENGEDWHLAGQKQTKQNTISDFISCAQYLIDKGYTSPAYLAGRGTSAGGITIGGALTQRPDLFTLAICNVGVMDILRFESEPNGPSNTPEFGTIKDPDGFKALYRMDAYQHVKDGTAYPAVLLITGANDPRVSPWHLLKMAARLQAATSGKKPILLRIDSDAGHGIGSSKTQRDLILADQTALLLSLAGKANAPGSPAGPP